MRTFIQQEVDAVYKRWLTEPFPDEGTDIDDYPEFNAYLGGFATQAIAGRPIGPGDVPRLTPSMQGAVEARIAQGCRELNLNHHRVKRLIELLDAYVTEVSRGR